MASPLLVRSLRSLAFSAPAFVSSATASASSTSAGRVHQRFNSTQTVTRKSKVWASADAAVADIKSGCKFMVFARSYSTQKQVGDISNHLTVSCSLATILSAGFGLCGTAETLIAAISQRTDLGDLEAVSNNGGGATGGGLSPLVASGQLSRMKLSFIGSNKALEAAYLSGNIALELVPQVSFTPYHRSHAVTGLFTS